MTYDIRMSVEDAVEIVLKDEALDVCAHCCGVGYIENEPDTPKSLVAGGLLSHRCPVCRGNITSFKPEYIEACVVLGKDVPRLRAYVTIERLRKNPLYKEQAGPFKLIDIKPVQGAKMTLRWGSKKLALDSDKDD